MAFGDIAFPGVTGIEYLIATRTVGVRPDKALLYCQPQVGSPDTSGTATLFFEFNGVAITWTNALCDKGTLRLNTHAFQQVFEIMDCRWSWSKAFYTKAYNVRTPSGGIIPATQATLAQIATDLFNYIGISADVSNITSPEFPQVTFDRHRVDDALDMILTQRGYVVSLQLNDTVVVYVRGTGATLPNNGDVVNANITIDPPEIPQYLTVCGARTMVQSKLLCKAVGLELDGSIKDVSNLSYMPAGGWTNVDMKNFEEIPGPEERSLAIKSVGKWYQVDTQADGTQNIAFGGVNYAPGEIVVIDASQLLPLVPSLLETEIDVYGVQRFSPPFLEFLVFQDDADNNPPHAANTPPFWRVDSRTWSLDRELGIVKLDEVAFQRSGGVQTFAEVYLTCSYSVSDSSTYVKDRYIRQRNPGGIGEDQTKIDDFERHVILGYSGGAVNSATDNQGSLNVQADQFLDAAENNYVTTAGNILLYRGIYPFNVDGVALQLRWNCAVPGAVPWGTLVAQNFEGLPQLPTNRERTLQRRTRMSSNPINRRNRQFHETIRKLR